MRVEWESFDIVVIGAGAAGCVLASRLSEQPGKKVLLLEAGPDVAADEHPHIDDPFPILDGNWRFLWPNLTVRLGDNATSGGPELPFLQGYGVGGSSNINGMAADRGQPQDYEDWVRSGASGWGWEQVLPHFKKVEHDLDFSGPMHGVDGPIPVRRVMPSDWAPFSAAVARAMHRRGLPQIADFNADFRDGVSSAPMNCLPDRRVSAAKAYLTRDVRRRSNLTILPGALAERLDIHAGRVRGVVAHTKHGRQHITAQTVIVSCGALQSPGLLLRSGIGSRLALERLGIPVIRDLPGVGQNLQNHVMIGLPVHLSSRSMQPAYQRAWLQCFARYSSRLANCSEHDMLAIAFNRVAWHALGRRVGALAIELHKPYSIGTVELASADPTSPPRICFNLLSDRRDFERLVSGLQLALEVLADSDVQHVRNEVFLPNPRIVARLSKRTFGNGVGAWIIARLFDAQLLRTRLLRKGVVDVPALARKEQQLHELVRLGAQPVYHVCGTCRMGHPDAVGTVVDPRCRVLGVQGLRVVDASIFPIIPSGSLHFPVLMTAEKMADEIRAEG